MWICFSWYTSYSHLGSCFPFHRVCQLHPGAILCTPRLKHFIYLSLDAVFVGLSPSSALLQISNSVSGNSGTNVLNVIQQKNLPHAFWVYYYEWALTCHSSPKDDWIKPPLKTQSSRLLISWWHQEVQTLHQDYQKHLFTHSYWEANSGKRVLSASNTEIINIKSRRFHLVCCFGFKMCIHIQLLSDHCAKRIYLKKLKLCQNCLQHRPCIQTSKKWTESEWISSISPLLHPSFLSSFLPFWSFTFTV